MCALRQLAAADEQPVRLPLGTDAIALVEGKLASVRTELDAWRELSESTDYPAS